MKSQVGVGAVNMHLGEKVSKTIHSKYVTKFLLSHELRLHSAVGQASAHTVSALNSILCSVFQSGGLGATPLSRPGV